MLWFLYFFESVANRDLSVKDWQGRHIIVMIAPLDHPWAKKGVAQLDDLLEARVIFRKTDSGAYGVFKQGLELAGMCIEDLQPVLTLSNAEAIALAVQEGLGVGFVSEVVIS